MQPMMKKPTSIFKKPSSKVVMKRPVAYNVKRGKARLSKRPLHRKPASGIPYTRSKSVANFKSTDRAKPTIPLTSFYKPIKHRHILLRLKRDGIISQGRKMFEEGDWCGGRMTRTSWSQMLESWSYRCTVKACRARWDASNHPFFYMTTKGSIPLAQQTWIMSNFLNKVPAVATHMQIGVAHQTVERLNDRLDFTLQNTSGCNKTRSSSMTLMWLRKSRLMRWQSVGGHPETRRSQWFGRNTWHHEERTPTHAGLGQDAGQVHAKTCTRTRTFAGEGMAGNLKQVSWRWTTAYPSYRCGTSVQQATSQHHSHVGRAPGQIHQWRVEITGICSHRGLRVGRWNISICQMRHAIHRWLLVHPTERHQDLHAYFKSWPHWKTVRVSQWRYWNRGSDPYLALIKTMPWMHWILGLGVAQPVYYRHLCD